ncbi:MAG: hypothetical protein AAF208_07995 [Cyanobacteria bacterium P01_A01_bin.45]
MSKEVPHIILPRVQSEEVEEQFAGYEISQEFHSEVEARIEFKKYCEWYRRTAEANRQELEKMRGELNLFQFFRRR